MTKDYAKPSTTRNKSKAGTKARSKKAAPGSRATSGASRSTPPEPPKKGKLLFILIVLLAAFLGGIYMLQTLPETNKAAPTPQPKDKAPPQKTAPAAEKPEQRFKFYDLLPESEVIPPKVDSYRFKEKSTSNDFFYMVQTGSFRTKADAERQKATIAFQGLKADIKQVSGKHGSTWYRVMTGPYYSRSEMNSALDKLVNIGIEPLVKKVKKQ